VTKKALEQLRSKAKMLEQHAPSSQDKMEQLRSFLEMMSLAEQAKSLPKGIVTHPAIVGRELSWSAARVDFWFNQMDLLSQEATAINGGQQMPDELRQIRISDADTWQFF